MSLSDSGGRKGMVLVISGPSGSGKSTIYKEAFKSISGFEFSVSCTTRPPREGEKDGADYNFMTREKFEELIRLSAFAEHAEVHGNLYGTLKTELTKRLDNGIDVLLDIYVQGSMQLKELCRRDEQFADACEFVFIIPPSFEVLEARLKARGTETPESLTKRLTNAKREMTLWKTYSYILINDQLEDSVNKFASLVTSFRMSSKRFTSEPFDE